MKTNIKKIYTCFPGGKHKVLTMSYDDGKHEDRRLVALFNQYGIKGTFNVNSGLEGDPVRILPYSITSDNWQMSIGTCCTGSN